MNWARLIDDKRGDDGAAPIHRARCVTGGGIVLFHVGDGARSLFQESKLDGGDDVQRDGNEQRDASGIKRGGQ